MVTSHDAEYRSTKLIRQGQAFLEPLFAELAAWIAATWDVTVLNVVYDELDPGRQPRLQVIVEHLHERERFCEGCNFDPFAQQAIAARFAELVTRHGSTSYRVERLLVVFAAFAPLAREEADSKIPGEEVRSLQQRIANPDLWTIHRCFAHVTFMFHTEEQARRHEQAGLRDEYAGQYFELLKRHDEFGYVQRDRFSVEFDSKENLDRNYAGSWMHYDR